MVPEMLMDLIQVTDTAILISDRALGELYYVNPAWARIFGLGPEVLCRQLGGVAGLIHPAERAEVAAGVRQLACGSWECQHRLVLENGVERHVRSCFTLLSSRPGEVERVAVCTEDVTREWRVEEERRQLIAILEATPDCVGIADAQGRPLYINSAGRRMLGLGRDEPLSMAHFSEFHDRPSQLRIQEEVLPRVFREGLWAGESCFLDREGRRIPISQVILAHRDAQGDILRLSTIARDVSPQKKNEEALRESEELLRVVAQTVPDFLILAERSGKIRYMNRVDYGFSMQEVQGSSCFDYVPSEYRETLRAAMEQAFQGQAPASFEIKGSGPHGENRWYMSRVAPLYREGRVENVLVIATDISERKRLEEERLQSTKLESLGRLAGGVAHDFNNLLTSILGHCDLAQTDSAKHSPLFRNLEVIALAAQRGAELTSQLLGFARRQRAEPQVVQLNELVGDAHRLLGRVLGERIELRVAVDPELPRVRIDPGQVSQVLMNLALNARDAMPRGGLLTIETRRLERLPERLFGTEGAAQVACAVLSVSDTGEGVPAEVLPHLFEPFFTTKPQGKGVGMGLATCYGIIKQNHGHIEVENRPGSGATFRIYLPATTAPLGLTSPAIQSKFGRGKGERILLVEDDDLLREMAQEVLELKGYRVQAFKNGQEVLARLAAQELSLDLLLTDVVIPGMSGPELARTLRAQRPDLRVLYISGYTQGPEVLEELEAGQGELLMKPFTTQQLTECLRLLLDRPLRADR